MRYRLMATYRGVPYEAGIGPTESEVVLFAACPPPEELGFEPATGHWRKQLGIEDVQALWESRPMGTFRGARCIVLDDMGDRLHIAYLGHDAYQAEQLGYWQVDRGVFELVTPRDEVKEIVEERVDYPQRSGGAPSAGAMGDAAGGVTGTAGAGTGAASAGTGAAGTGTGASGTGTGAAGAGPGATGDGRSARADAAAMTAGASAAAALTGDRPGPGPTRSGTGANGVPEARFSPGTDAAAESRFSSRADTAGETRFSTGAGIPGGSRPAAGASAAAAAGDPAAGNRFPAEAETARFSAGGGAPGGARPATRSGAAGGTRSAAGPGARPATRAGAPGRTRSDAAPNPSAGAGPAAVPGPADFASDSFDSTSRSFDSRGDDTATRDLAVIPPSREAPLPLEAAARAASARSQKAQRAGRQAQPSGVDPAQMPGPNPAQPSGVDPAQMSGPHPTQPPSQSQRPNMRQAQAANLAAAPGLPQTPPANHQGQPPGAYPAPPPNHSVQLPTPPQAPPANHQSQPPGPHPAQLPHPHQAQAESSLSVQPADLHQSQPPNFSPAQLPNLPPGQPPNLAPPQPASVHQSQLPNLAPPQLPNLPQAPSPGLQPAPPATQETEPPPSRRRRSAQRRLATERIFSELAGLAAIPPSAYAVGEEVDGAMCLIQTADGFEVFNAAAGARHEIRLFDDEESAYFYLFGVLAAEAVRTGRLAPQDYPGDNA